MLVVGYVWIFVFNSPLTKDYFIRLKITVIIFTLHGIEKITNILSAHLNSLRLTTASIAHYFDAMIVQYLILCGYCIKGRNVPWLRLVILWLVWVAAAR